ncbi:MAG: DNA topoisomerase I [Candidatus Aenigmarchaeota archaeon]|nr:DNA topoisomerase I [Candidatus Aenigmarchaeota archaeon]
MSILIIAEKPSAMKKIAFSLAEKSLIKKSYRGVPYYTFLKNGKFHVVVSCLGHLYGLSPKKKGLFYPIFETEWVPIYVMNKKMRIAKKFSEAIRFLSRKVNEIIIATDFDIEGAVIGWNALRFLCNRNNAKRMKFSTLTKQELNKAYINASNELDFGQINAGLTRHYLDWIWGINISRALTIAIRKFTNDKKVLSIGRVQGPTLKIVYDREKEIENFKPKTFWKIQLILEKNGQQIVAEYEKERIDTLEEAKKIREKILSEKNAIVDSYTETLKKLNPPPPFNTTDLQSEAYSAFKIKPEETLKIAESLYIKGFISYPRSSSQKIKNVNFIQILRSLKNNFLYAGYVNDIFSLEKIIPKEGKKDDPAHPAITPTNEVPEINQLSKKEFMIYDLIVRRFLSCLHEPAIRKNKKAVFRVSGYRFIASSIKTVKENWVRIYRRFLSLEESDIPEFRKGESVRIVDVKLVKGKTQPPKRYTKASLVKEMERRELGTKGTRANIVKTLFDRGYLVGEKIKITDLGKTVIKVMSKYVPLIISEELTRKFEEEMNLIMEGRKSRKEVEKEARKTLEKILGELKKNQESIGKELANSLKTTKPKKKRGRRSKR